MAAAIRVNGALRRNPHPVPAAPGCGLVYELYQRRLSFSIDVLLNDLPEEYRPQAIEIARAEYDYLTAEEVDEAERQDQEQGYCVHGLDPYCCPVGCGDIENGDDSDDYFFPSDEGDFDEEQADDSADVVAPAPARPSFFKRLFSKINY